MLTSLLKAARRRREHPAIRGDDQVVTYGDLLSASALLGGRLLEALDATDLDGARVALLAEPGAGWVEATWAVWRAGGHVVPLALSHPEPELEHVLTDADASMIVVQPNLRHRIEPLARRLELPVLLPRSPSDSSSDSPSDSSSEDDGPSGNPSLSELSPEDMAPELEPEDTAERFALLLYTSGTTGRPKGVPIRFRHLEAQVRSLSKAWRWSRDDHILGVLPLHHVHGIVNVVLSALWHGATCTLHRRFDAERAWRSFRDDRPSLFMAVPTIYRRLIEEWRARPELQAERSRAARRLRLMVSGSAALPETTLDAWREISGHTLLERYGMTEIGMALSQPYDGESVPGTVGGPLPGVEVRLQGGELPGELLVRGPGVFDGYWRRPGDTAEALADDGWFRTGDVATREDLTPEEMAAGGEVFRLLGRRSVDILKSGGEKISVLEIEAVLRRHHAVADAAVVGVPDAEWGQKVVAFVETAPQGTVDSTQLADELNALCRRRLAAFKVPKRYEIVDRLPRNALGKVLKGKILEEIVLEDTVVKGSPADESS